MRIDFTERNVHLPDAWRQYAEKKLDKLSRYFKSDPDVRVSVRKERERYKCETTIHADIYFRASVETTDMYASLDACVASIERQIRKHRTKLEKRLHVKAFEPHEDYDAVLVDDSEYTVTRRKSFNMKPMTAEEAILQMKLLSHEFYVFRDSENGEAVSVAYCRNDGGYGIISEA